MGITGSGREQKGDNVGHDIGATQCLTENATPTNFRGVRQTTYFNHGLKRENVLEDAVERNGILVAEPALQVAQHG